MWLLAELFHNREGAIVAKTQTELARANAQLIQEFQQTELKQIPIAQLADGLRVLSTATLSEYGQVEGGFYLLTADRLLGYAYPTHRGPKPKRDIPPVERGIILELARLTTISKVPQTQIIKPGPNIVVLRSDPLPLGGAVWTMKRIPEPEDTRPTVLTALIIVMDLFVVAWTVYIALQLQYGVQQLQRGIKAIEEGKAEQIAPLPAEMGLLGASINTMHQRRQELEHHLRRMDRLASLGQLVAGVAHEVRNPLASMRLNLQYVKRQLQRQGITNLPLPSLLEQVDRLELLVKRLLYFDQTQQQEDIVSTSLEAIAEESVSLFRLQAEQQGVSLIYHSPAKPLVLVPLRRQQIGQVMLNLLLNAIQASPSAGQVDVGVEQQENYLVAWVEDRGQGISLENREQIFNPFYSTKSDGTGLGLSISHEIVAQHGGYIDLNSQPGSTRFSIYLPCSPLVPTTNSDNYGKNFDR